MKVHVLSRRTADARTVEAIRAGVPSYTERSLGPSPPRAGLSWSLHATNVRRHRRPGPDRHCSRCGGSRRRPLGTAAGRTARPQPRALHGDAPGGRGADAPDGGGHAGDVVYDLGCGDGRLVIAAAKRYGARGVGGESIRAFIAQSRANAKREGVEGLVEFRRHAALTVDLSPASVVTLYLLSAANLQLRPRLQAQLKPG